MSDETSKVAREKRGGRVKGTPNRRSWNLRKELEDAGFEPVHEMLALLHGTEDADKKWSRIVWLFRHLYPQLAEVQQLPDTDPPEKSAASTRSTEALLALANRT